jgi:DNA polymerase-3 subunit gamma/tau
MNNKILALKYRPHFFNEVVGQENCVQSLSNSIKLNKIHNAYLFSGTRGVGKTTIARIFAKSLLCKKGISETPCGKCDSCIEIDNNNNLDLIEIDAASRTKVEDTRTLMENVQYAPSSSRYKIYLIDEVHMLSTKSFNALLKTIEEPPEHVKFLLATTEPDKLPETIISRCLHFKLESITNTSLTNHIINVLTRENIPYDEDVPELIANFARGSARDSMSILEQCISYGNGELKQSKIIKLLGVIDHTIVDDIIINLLNNSLQNINEILNNSDISNYTKLLDMLIERVFQVSLSRKLNSNEYNLKPELLNDSVAPQDLQLWYSILLQAKEQIHANASKSDHLLMILLRISLFTEYNHKESDNPPVKSANIDISSSDSKKKNKTELVQSKKSTQVELSKWKSTIENFNLQGLMLDLAYNSMLDLREDATVLTIDKSKENTYPKKCMTDFSILICSEFKTEHVLSIEYSENINSLYKQSVKDNINSKNEMYESIKNNKNLKEIESIFDAKIDKDNISKL